LHKLNKLYSNEENKKLKKFGNINKWGQNLFDTISGTSIYNYDFDLGQLELRLGRNSQKYRNRLPTVKKNK